MGTLRHHQAAPSQGIRDAVAKALYEHDKPNREWPCGGFTENEYYEYADIAIAAMSQPVMGDASTRKDEDASNRSEATPKSSVSPSEIPLLSEKEAVQIMVEAATAFLPSMENRHNVFTVAYRALLPKITQSEPALLRSFVESITSAVGPYTDLNGHRIVADAYRVLRAATVPKPDPMRDMILSIAKGQSAPTEPVSVSLEDGAKALYGIRSDHCFLGETKDFLDWENQREEFKAHYRTLAKQCAEAWGVTYV